MRVLVVGDSRAMRMIIGRELRTGTDLNGSLRRESWIGVTCDLDCFAFGPSPGAVT